MSHRLSMHFETLFFGAFGSKKFRVRARLGSKRHFLYNAFISSRQIRFKMSQRRGGAKRVKKVSHIY
jgi:hypothetical protein